LTADLLTPEQRHLVEQVRAVNEEAAQQMETKFLVSLGDALIQAPQTSGAPGVQVDPDAAKAAEEEARKERQRQFDRDAEEAGAKALAETEAKMEEAETHARALMDLTLQPRHMEAFEWAWRTADLTPGRFLQQVLRTAAASWRQDMLEARGQGGSTSRKKPPTE
jgi:hypothetical protein